MDFDACISAVIAEHLEENFIGYEVSAMGLLNGIADLFQVPISGVL